MKQALDYYEGDYRLAIKDYFGEAVNLLDAKTYQEAQYSAHIGGALVQVVNR
ncbi:hypothetical protein Tsubulata_002914, partial [Turnera subulata]